LNEESIVWDPSAAMVAADPVIRRRLSIMAFSYWTSSPFRRSDVAFILRHWHPGRKPVTQAEWPA
jgi:hypothetical protein